MKAWISLLLGLMLGLAPMACRRPEAQPSRALWKDRTPDFPAFTERFTVRILELDGSGNPKDPEQWGKVLAAARKADDAFIFIHGWRRDARDVKTMEAFLEIYRSAFECLSNRDVENTLACSAIHTYCHPPKLESKLVVLALWDGDTGMLGFPAAQARAKSIGSGGFGRILSDLHEAVRPRGTLFAMGHSLGATALATTLSEASKRGPLPLDGALLVAGAFDVDILDFPHHGVAPPLGSLGTVVLNLFNRKDGYLRFYRWFWGKPAAGAEGLQGIPVSDGVDLDRAEDACGQGKQIAAGGTLWKTAHRVFLPHGGAAELLNLDVTQVLRGHADIENPHAIHLYNHAVAEGLFLVLQSRSHAFPSS